jgi:carboxypeptidase PM20D1
MLTMTALLTIAIPLLVLILFVMAVILFRTARFPKMSDPIEPAPPLEIDAELVAEHIGRAAQHQTTSSTDPAHTNRIAFLTLQRELEGMFPKLHATLKRETLNDLTLLYTWEGKNRDLEPILLSGHLDVVPAETTGPAGEWIYPPFSGQVAEGFVWGRGTLDTKGSVVAAMEAVEYLIKDFFEPERTVYLAFGHDEEVGGVNGARAIAATLKMRTVHLACVIDEGGFVIQDILAGVTAPVAMVGIAEKGYLSLELSASGPGGHSALPPDHTVIGVLAGAIQRIEANPFPTRLDATQMMLRHVGTELPFMQQVAFANLWLFGGLALRQILASPRTAALARTTTAVTMISGGIKENVLPSQASAVLNLRLLPGDTLRSVYERVLEVVNDPQVTVKPVAGDTLEGPMGWEPTPVSDPQAEEFKFLSYIIGRIFPEAVVAPYLVYGATDARWYTEICQNIYRFSPALIDAGELARMHACNERLSVKNCGRMVAFYVEFLEKMVGARP